MNEQATAPGVDAETERYLRENMQRHRERLARVKAEDPQAVGAVLTLMRRGQPSPREFIERSAEERAHAEARRMESKRVYDDMRARTRKAEAWLEFSRDAGERLAECTLDNFELRHKAMQDVVPAIREYVANIQANVEAGRGILLLGPEGTGKDHLCCGVVRECIKRMGVSARWLDGCVFREMFRDNIKRQRAERQLLFPYVSCGVLVLSDPVAPHSKLTPYQWEALRRLIDGRWRAKRPTFCTANLASIADADKILDPSVVGRLIQGGIKKLCNWPSERRR